MALAAVRRPRFDVRGHQIEILSDWPVVRRLGRRTTGQSERVVPRKFNLGRLVAVRAALSLPRLRCLCRSAANRGYLESTSGRFPTTEKTDRLKASQTSDRLEALSHLDRLEALSHVGWKHYPTHVATTPFQTALRCCIACRRARRPEDIERRRRTAARRVGVRRSLS